MNTWGAKSTRAVHFLGGTGLMLFLLAGCTHLQSPRSHDAFLQPFAVSQDESGKYWLHLPPDSQSLLWYKVKYKTVGDSIEARGYLVSHEQPNPVSLPLNSKTARVVWVDGEGRHTIWERRTDRASGRLATQPG